LRARLELDRGDEVLDYEPVLAVRFAGETAEAVRQGLGFEGGAGR
jgi:hypothetical protein